MIQLVIVLLLIAGAAVFLGARAWKSWSGRKTKGCEKCGKPD